MPINKKYKDLDEFDKLMIKSELEKNISEEANARQNYYELMSTVADEHKQIIQNIISDELDHSIILARLIETYGGAKPKEFENYLNIGRK